MLDLSQGYTHNTAPAGRWQRALSAARRWWQAPAPRRAAPMDLLEARDHMLRDIGLLDGPDMALRRSDLELPSERPPFQPPGAG